jgi:hypothetical protein
LENDDLNDRVPGNINSFNDDLKVY